MSATIDLVNVSIDDLDQLPDFESFTRWTKTCTACSLRESATEPVHYDGDPSSPIMFVGMNPGFVEDGTQIPFAGRAELARSRCVGCTHYHQCYEWQTNSGTAHRPRVERCLGFTPLPAGAAKAVPPNAVLAGKFKIGGLRTAGQIFDDLLDALGIDRSKLFITNSALCKSVANASPRAQEYNRCSSIRIRSQRFVQPKIIVTLGNDATQQYTGKKLTMKVAHGVPIEGSDSVIQYIIVPTYHPSYIFRMMLASGTADLAQLDQFKKDIAAAKWDMYSDMVTAFNLLGPALTGIVKDTSKLVDGKLPVKVKT